MVWGTRPGPRRAFAGPGLVFGDPATSYPRVAYSDIDVDSPGAFGDPAGEAPNAAGSTNINCDPLVANAAINDVHLTTCSPAIDRASHALAAARYDELFTGPFATFGFDFGIFSLAAGEHRNFDYDDPNAPPEGAFHNDATGPRPRTPRLPVVGGPPGCEADMGADEFVRELTDELRLYCDPGGDGLDLTQVAYDSPCEQTSPGGECGPFCAGDDVCLVGQFQGLCPEGVVYQWYFRPASGPVSPTPCMPPVSPIGQYNPICGATSATLCLSDITVEQAGCYRLVARRASCIGPARFYCYEPPIPLLGGSTPLCDDELVVEICIDVYAGPTVNVQPQPAQVCVGGQQQICATFDIPVDCVEPNIRWYYVPATDCNLPICPPVAPAQGMYIDPANQSDGIAISFDPVPGQPGKYRSCLTFSPAAFMHAGRYYVTIDCGSETCGDRSQCALLTVYEQPVIVVQPQPRAACISGMQTLTLTAELDQRTLKCPATPGGSVPPIQLEVLWYRVSSCTAPVPDPMFPNPVCTTACTTVNAQGRVVSNCTVTVDPTPGNQFYRATVRACTAGLTPTKCPAVVSDCVTLTVVDPRPCVESRVVCVNGTQCLTVNPASLPMLPMGYTYTFRWFFLGEQDCVFPTCDTCTQNPTGHGAACMGGMQLSDTGPYTGTMTDTLRITMAQLTHRGRYYVQIGLDGPDAGGDPDPGKCMANSNCACLIVVDPNPQVPGRTVCEGGTQYLELASPLPMLPCGYTYDYQWFFAGTSACVTNANCTGAACPAGTALMNNARYSDVTTNRLCIMGATPDERGCYYVRVRINAPSGCTPAVLPCDRNSNCACLNVIPQPTIVVQPQDAYVCLGNEQCFSVVVGYTGTAPLCWEWRRKVDCPSTGSTVVSSGTWTLGQPLMFTYCVTPTPADPNDRCYFFRVRVCDPDDEDKCPPYDSVCACLTVLPPIVPCTLTCPSGLSDGSGNCLFCDRSQITLCCNVTSTAEPLCYQWYYSPTPCTPGALGCGMPIPGATSMCFEFEFNAQNIGLPCGRAATSSR